MTKTIFKSVFAVGISVMLFCAVLFFGLQYRETYDETYAALQQEAVYAENGLKIGGMHYLETLGSINRITWIAADGSVRYDSECAGETANQAGYPEVRDAFSSGEGKGIRPLVQKRCDQLFTIPMPGRFNSLNASAAAAVILFEYARRK